MVAMLHLLASILYPTPPARADGLHADSIVVGITIVCVFLLLLIVLFTTTSYYFFLKNDTVKKGVPAVSS